MWRTREGLFRGTPYHPGVLAGVVTDQAVLVKAGDMRVEVSLLLERSAAARSTTCEVRAHRGHRGRAEPTGHVERLIAMGAKKRHGADAHSLAVTPYVEQVQTLRQETERSAGRRPSGSCRRPCSQASAISNFIARDRDVE
jgi:hypothetical protein